MLKLTLIDALKQCEALWSWLSESGSRFKYTWPGWKDLDSYTNDCPCCEYAEQVTKDRPPCEYCPMLLFWQNDDYTRIPCESSSSQYRKWRFSSHSNLSKHARKIAEGAREMRLRLEKQTSPTNSKLEL
jgi:hypothetical protein